MRPKQSAAAPKDTAQTASKPEGCSPSFRALAGRVLLRTAEQLDQLAKSFPDDDEVRRAREDVRAIGRSLLSPR